MNIISFYKVSALPSSPKKDSVYFVKNGTDVHLYVTDSNGAPHPVTEDGVVVTADYVKALVVEFPRLNENISIFFTDVAISINKLVAVIRGSSVPSLTWTIRHNPSRSAIGSEVITDGTTTTTSTGQVVTTFDDATIPANSFIWFETTAMSGTIDEFSVTIVYTKD